MWWSSNWALYFEYSTSGNVVGSMAEHCHPALCHLANWWQIGRFIWGDGSNWQYPGPILLRLVMMSNRFEQFLISQYNDSQQISSICVCSLYICLCSWEWFKLDLFTCNYCPTGTGPIQHHNNWLLKHLSDVKTCHNAPDTVRKEALVELMRKSGVTLETNVGPSVSSTMVQVKRKKRKVAESGTLDGFVDLALMESQEQDANIKLLWQVL